MSYTFFLLSFSSSLLFWWIENILLVIVECFNAFIRSVTTYETAVMGCLQLFGGLVKLLKISPNKRKIQKNVINLNYK
jgi:hypothetical protein